MADGLFPAEPFLAPETGPLPADPVSAGRRLTQRQAEAVRLGAHPLARVDPSIRIHPDADPDRTASADNAASRPLRCGTCRHRTTATYPKCLWRPSSPGPVPRVTHGPASDVRAWWPACRDWQPREEG
ncbi:hypothetical protein O7627_24255 [Solwaraspora sp. WMMD1047]|uniref:hypothetical protein n=1 Tax=Solwaraspora sp. WMMD1047 TaxID=3016102 RepID=UPI002415A40C|nr:hypothetical protein [Solwaraspora sp. WMMD1047]MDG4832396.1 hypothetical protein [Solwaraspora sp. WMMD1047]